MENDSIRSVGSETLVDIWIEGKMRALCLSQEAIGAFLGFEVAGGMSDLDRRDFERPHLPLIISAAKSLPAETGADVEALTIDVGQLPRGDGRSGEGRAGDRRLVGRGRAPV